MIDLILAVIVYAGCGCGFVSIYSKYNKISRYGALILFALWPVFLVAESL